MDRIIHDDCIYENQVYRENILEPGDYENCIFRNCDFTEADLSGINFEGCEFHECNMSLSILMQTTISEVKFIKCKLLGLHFEDCNRLIISFSLDSCSLELCSFNKLKLKKSVFKNSRITEADFTETDLSSSIIKNCDLDRSVFRMTNLENADLRGSYNFSVDPDLNRIRRARFSAATLAGLMGKYDIIVD
ncbi:MAG TPA: pentapeptide repeat-containing protein [Bacteroidales bacterium]|nr:pentapeptide repeat-containing protein [Bacteroidales bacterium]